MRHNNTSEIRKILQRILYIAILSVVIICGSVFGIYHRITGEREMIPKNDFTHVETIKIHGLEQDQYNPKHLYDMLLNLKGKSTVFGECICVEETSYTIIIEYKDKTIEKLYITPSYYDKGVAVVKKLPGGLESHHPPLRIAYNTDIQDYLDACSNTVIDYP